MTRFRNYLVLGVGALAVIIGVGAAGFVAAQDQGDRPDRRPFMGRGGPGGPMGGLMLGELDLTEAQREQVRTIMETRRAADEPLMERAQAARQALQTAIQTQPVDEATIRARSADLATIEADLAVSRARLQAEILALLTPEQRTELEQQQAQMRERMETRGGRRGR